MTARRITPFEKTRRSPRFSNWRGRKRSRARIEESRGKSWYEVFAARTRIAAVNDLDRVIEAARRGRRPSAIWATTDFESLGIGWAREVGS